VLNGVKKLMRVYHFNWRKIMCMC